jgi:MarR family transcriptional regulator for hemolysin
MVLGWLALEGELSQAELAARMMVEPPTLVGILDRMERDGWIARHDCPDDRRKNLIRATSAAEPAWEKIVACGMRVRERAAAGLSERQLATLRRLLQQVERNLSVRDEVLAGK